MEKQTNKKCFIITPIGNDGSETRKRAEGVISAVIEPVLNDNNYEIIISHRISDSGSITNQIIGHILNDSLVIANLTGLNPNVMYELAVRHAKRKPVICIIEKNTQLPFDLAGDRTIFYDDNMASVTLTKKALDEAIKSIKDDEKLDNPIYRAIQNEIALIQNENISQMAKKIDGVEGNTLKIILDKLNLMETQIVLTKNKDRTISYEVPINIKIGKSNRLEYVTINERHSVQIILDNIFWLIQDEVAAYEYMKSWVLKEKTTGMYLIMNEIRNIIPSNLVFRPDFSWEVVKWENSIIQQHW